MAGESSTNRMVGAIVQIRIANIEFGTVFDYPLKHEWRACNLSPRSPSDCQVQLSLPKTCTGCMLLLSAAWRKRYGNAKTLNSMGSATRCKHSGSSHSNLATMRLLASRSEEHTSELQSRVDLVCRLL